MTRRRLSALFAAASLAWAVLIVAVPYLVARHPDAGLTGPLAAAAYLTGHVVCHQIPARSFHPFGAQMPVCARCAGLYAAAPLGAGLALALGVGVAGGRRRPTAALVRAVLVTTALPTAATWTAEWLGLAHPSSLVRFAAALPLGAAIAWVVATAIGGEIG
jgi:uncharacterized membrane protein